MSEMMTITEFQESDMVALIELWQKCGLIAKQNNPQKDIERKLKQGREYFLVGKVAGNVIASVMGGYEGHRGWANYLAVEPTVRRLGFGLMMMDALEARLVAVGCAKINLQVRRSNQSVIDFYHSQGYSDDEVVSLGKRLEIDSTNL